MNERLGVRWIAVFVFLFKTTPVVCSNASTNKKPKCKTKQTLIPGQTLEPSIEPGSENKIRKYFQDDEAEVK